MFRFIKLLVIVLFLLTSCKTHVLPKASSASLVCDKNPYRVTTDTKLPVTIVFNDGRISSQDGLNSTQNQYFVGTFFRPNNGTETYELFSYNFSDEGVTFVDISSDKNWLLVSHLQNHLQEQRIYNQSDFWIVPLDGVFHLHSIDESSGEKIVNIPKHRRFRGWLNEDLLLFTSIGQRSDDFTDDLLIILNAKTQELREYNFSVEEHKYYYVNPQGTHVAYFDELHYPNELNILHFESNKTIKVDLSLPVYGTDVVNSIDWSPSGKYLALEMDTYLNKTLNYGVYLIDLEGNASQLIDFNQFQKDKTKEFYTIENIDWNADGTKIAISTTITTTDNNASSIDENIYIYDFKKRNLVRLCYLSSPVGGPVWSLDGNYIWGAKSPTDTIYNDWIVANVNTGEAWEFPDTNFLNIRYFWEVE